MKAKKNNFEMIYNRLTKQPISNEVTDGMLYFLLGRQAHLMGDKDFAQTWFDALEESNIPEIPEV